MSNKMNKHAHSTNQKVPTTAELSRGISIDALRSQKSAGSGGRGDSLEFVAEGTLPD